ncbi:hypothetical protein DERP_007592 [Dermatophagoides pteronyssinus]|uniref:Cation/H+ exchanger transmembrane domain-containing protein n=1 Tax=Dermatophagoides pteronyssinus TaxID=6956 RepID=A0ABQ8JK71_DERPT|nr:hypothetical protein DERP_007592 [Dermatophagoides pteronyssinus]
MEFEADSFEENDMPVKHPQFYRNLLPILLYAIIGTLINIILIGMSLYAVMNINNDPTLSSISVLEMMIFSTSISAIDPVCVLALFKDFKVKKSLYYLVFGESLLNDAVVIVVHGILIETFRSTTSRSFSTITLFLNGFIKFVVVSFGSLFIGLFHGIFSTILTIIASKNRNGHYQEIEPILMIILSYGSYMIAELIGWSGVLSIIACGLFQTEFALANVSIRSRITVKSSIETLRNSENILSRISIIWNNYYQKINNDSDCNDFQSNTSSMNMSTYQLFQTTTLFIIIFTVFIMGSTTQPLLAYLKIVSDNKHNRQAKLSKKPSCCCRFQCLPRQSNEKLFDRLNNQLFDDTSKSILSLIMTSTTIQSGKISKGFQIKEMVNNCNLRSSSSIVYPVTINIRSESNDGIQSNGNGNVVRNEREKVSIIEIDSIPTL